MKQNKYQTKYFLQLIRCIKIINQESKLKEQFQKIEKQSGIDKKEINDKKI